LTQQALCGCFLHVRLRQIYLHCLIQQQSDTELFTQDIGKLKQIAQFKKKKKVNRVEVHCSQYKVINQSSLVQLNQLIKCGESLQV